MKGHSLSQSPNLWAWLIGCTLLIFSLAYFSPVSYADADPLFSLIVSQAILEQQTIKLDAYEETLVNLFPSSFWQTGRYQGSLHYNYPTGTSIFSLPFVALARLMNLDMLDRADNHQLQRLISAILCALAFVIIYLIGRYYIEPVAALVIALISVMGSSLISTMASALWNMNFTVLFILLSMLLISRFDSKQSDTINGYLLGFLLFAAYLCRPSAAIFILITFIYLFLKDKGAYQETQARLGGSSITLTHLMRSLFQKRVFWQTAVTSAILFLFFVAFSWLNYGRLLPFYYSTSTWLAQRNIIQPLWAVLVSPSRGLFIFSPIFALVITLGIIYARHLRSSLLFWLCALWFILQLVVVSNTVMWWGGYSFGPRLLTDALPALVVMSIILWQTVTVQIANGRTQFIIKTAYLSLGLMSIFIHSWQGLLNTKTSDWNNVPPISENLEYLFDWQYPQFLITTESFHERWRQDFSKEWHQGNSRLSPYTIEDGFTSNNVTLFGWWPHDDNWWSEIQSPQIVFIVDSINRETDYDITISTSARKEPHHILIKINGTEIGHMQVEPELTTHTMQFSGSLFKEHSLNEIVFELTDSRYPGWKDIVDFRLYPLVFRTPQLQIVPVSNVTSYP